MTPPQASEAAMTAQAGAVAACPFCGEPLKTVSVSEGSTFRWRKVDGCCADGPEVRHDTTADDQAAAELESTRKAIAAWNERPTPPAAVSVEALEGLVDAIRPVASMPLEEYAAFDNAPANKRIFGANDWNLTVGDIRRLRAALANIEQLIKERSNG